MRGRTLGLYILCCAVWGSTWLVIKIGLQDLPPFLFGAVRMAIAAAALSPLAFRSGFPNLHRREWLWIACSGSLQLGLSYAGVFAAERYISSGLTATLFCSYPIWTLMLAHWMLPGERAGMLHLGSAILGILGILVLEAPLLGSVRLAPDIVLAMLIPLGSAICSGLGGVLLKKHLGRVELTLNLWAQTLIGAGVLWVFHLCFDGAQSADWTARAVAAILYLAILGTVVTFLALFWLIPRVPMALIGVIPLIDTLIALALGAAVLGEPIGWRLAFGGALVLAGAALASRIRQTPDALAETATP